MALGSGDSTVEGDQLAARPSELVLLVFGADSSVSFVLPREGEVTIGRAKEADVRTQDASISRLHARLSVRRAADTVTLQLEDLASANGTSVRGEKLEQGRPVTLSPGELVDLGHATMVVQSPRLPPLDGGGALMLRVQELAARVANATVSVLITGETGAGKEVLAEQIHTRSLRSKHPLVRVPCESIGAVAIERELFGDETKPGIFESASGSSVLLDEVGELPLAVQSKLLRVIEERSVVRTGSLESRPVDVRFLSTTNRDLPREIERGQFRSDLYFRLNAVSITVPPLRERTEEIAPLARMFAEREGKRLSRAAVAKLTAHRWPGNIRELKNLITRAALLADGAELSADAFTFEPAGPEPAPAPARASASPLKSPAAEVPDELREILAVMEKCGGNQTRAAAVLGIARGTLISRLEQYGIARPKKRGRD